MYNYMLLTVSELRENSGCPMDSQVVISGNFLMFRGPTKAFGCLLYAIYWLCHIWKVYLCHIWKKMYLITGASEPLQPVRLWPHHFSALKKKKKKTHLQDWRIGKLNNFLVNISHNPFYNNPILTYCTNYGLNFLKALASRGLRPLTPTRGSAPWIPPGGHTPRPPSSPYHF